MCHAYCWTQSWPVRHRSSEPRYLESRLRRLRAVRAVLTRLDCLAGYFGPWIRATRLGRQRRSLLLAHSIAERVDDRYVPSGMGDDWHTRNPIQTAQHWRVVWLLRSPDVACGCRGPLRHVAMAVARIGDTNRRR